jgi:hypothetical protein
MEISTHTVVEGKVFFDGDITPDGTIATVFATDFNESFEIPPDLEQDLDESLAEAARGENTRLAEVLSRLRKTDPIKGS